MRMLKMPSKFTDVSVPDMEYCAGSRNGWLTLWEIVGIVSAIAGVIVLVDSGAERQIFSFLKRRTERNIGLVMIGVGFVSVTVSKLLMDRNLMRLRRMSRPQRRKGIGGGLPTAYEPFFDAYGGTYPVPP